MKYILVFLLCISLCYSTTFFSGDYRDQINYFSMSINSCRHWVSEKAANELINDGKDLLYLSYRKDNVEDIKNKTVICLGIALIYDQTFKNKKLTKMYLEKSVEYSQGLDYLQKICVDKLKEYNRTGYF